ncbi:hypothetical protein MCO_00642, partial [Bartonella sp. DB5-6]
MTKEKNKSIDPHPCPQLVLTLDVRRTLEPSFLHQILQIQTSQPQTSQPQTSQPQTSQPQTSQ